MKPYYDEDDYPLPEVEKWEMESQVIQSIYGWNNIIASYKDDRVYGEAKFQTRGNRKSLDDLIYNAHNYMRIAYTDSESCRLIGAKINMARNTSVKIMKMSTGELLAEYENLE